MSVCQPEKPVSPLVIRFLLDEHIPVAVLRYFQRTYPDHVNVVRVVDVGLKGALDPEVLAWAAQEDRVLISEDKATLTDFAYERINLGQPMPGVITVTRALPLRALLGNLHLSSNAVNPATLRT